MTGGGSVVVRRQLGVRLRRLREAAHKELADVVESGIGSKAKISRIENGRLPVRMADVRALCWLYGADQPTTDALAALAPGTQQDDWWEQYGEAVGEGFGLYVGLEATASRLRGFSPEVVRGLLQTPEYARALIGADPRRSPDVVEQRVQFRMERQRAVFDAAAARPMTFVLAEGALLLGPPDIVRSQIAHLRDVAERPGVEVRVLPSAAGLYPTRGDFVLLDFDDAEDPAVVYVQLPMAARYFDGPADWADYEYVFELVLGRSIPIEEWKPWTRPPG